MSLALSACQPTRSNHKPAPFGNPPSAQAAAPPTSTRKVNDAEQVAQLAAIVKMRGHLHASYSLWKLKLFDDAATHSSEHLLEELMYAVRTPLKNKNPDAVMPLQDKITSYGKSLNKNVSTSTVEKNYKAVISVLDESYALLLNGDAQDFALHAAVVRDVLDSSAGEYDEAVLNGKVTNAEEWQDTLGFLIAARELYTTAVEPNLSTVAAEKMAALNQEFSALVSYFPSYIKFPATVMPTTQFSQRIETLSQLLSEVANLPPPIRLPRILQGFGHHAEQAAKQYVAGNFELAQEYLIKAEIDGLTKARVDLAKINLDLLRDIETQFENVNNAIKSRAAAAKVEKYATGLDLAVERALNVVSPSRKPGSKH
ncbi:MAG: hypothetical protein KIH69_007645 [Anaerolineae bacterium]|nr:hypothetical protein [Anaerolineae bacterium]